MLKILLILLPILYCNSFALSGEFNTDNLKFNVYRNDSKIGYHNLYFTKDQDSIKSKINIEFEVNFLGFTLYEYSHQNVELWIDDSLFELRTETDKNGENLSCNFRKINDDYQIDGSFRKKLIKYAPVPTSYWNKKIVANESLTALNTQDCSDLEFTVSYLGQDLIYNSSLLADHYKLLGKESSGDDVDIDLWYDNKNKWVKMKFVKDGSEIDYILEQYDSK